MKIRTLRSNYVMKKILLTAFAISVSSLLFAQDKTFGEFKFNDKQKHNRFYQDFSRWAQQDVESPPGKDAVLFIGSSSMKLWDDIETDLKPLNVIHRGFGGSRMDDVLIWENFFLRYKVNTVVIYEGDNDMVNNSLTPAKFVESCQQFSDAMRKANPEIQIYFISIKPSPIRAKLWPKMKEANQLLQAYSEKHDYIHYIESSNEMLDNDGAPRTDIVGRDRLHMNRKGYDIWKKNIRAALIN